jgi:hypothetical protein
MLCESNALTDGLTSRSTRPIDEPSKQSVAIAAVNRGARY